MASSPQFSVAGALATGTHGSSGTGADGRVVLGGMAAAVAALELVGADGALRRLARGDADFPAAVVSLGLMGVAARVTLGLVEDFDVSCRTYGRWPLTGAAGPGLGALIETLPAALRQTSSLSAFVDWTLDDFGLLICRDFVPRGAAGAPEPPPEPGPAAQWAGAPLLTEPIDDFIEGGALPASGRGRWHDRLHNFMRGCRPFGPQAAEFQIEHFVPLERAQEALSITRSVASLWGGNILYCELRAVRADEQLLAPYTSAAADGGPCDSLAIAHGMHASMGQRRVLAAAAVLEEALEPLGARPHWGKLFSTSPADIKRLYGPRLLSFREARERADPQRKFSHAWLDRMLLDE